MNLNNLSVQEFARAELNTFNLKEFNLDESLALNELSKEIRSEWEELNSSEVKKSRWEFFKIPGTKPEDYSERLLTLKDGRKLIYGIRHFGGDRNLPFVNLRPNFKIKGSEDALELYRLIEDMLAPFRALGLCFWSDRQLAVDQIHSTYLVATASEIKAMKPWSEEVNLVLRVPADDSYYANYELDYKKFHLERPDLKPKVTLNSLDIMETSREQGLLCEVFYQGTRMGLIAAEKSALLGHEGLYFNEIFIETKWKGRGLAKALQRKFVQQYARDEDLIWGTIYSSNLPSYQTAIRNGRRAIRFECFVDVF